MITTIYALLDEASQVRYIGKTKTKLLHRLHGHIKEARHGGNTHKNKWIRKCLSSNYRPEIVPLLTVEGTGVKEEIAYIRKYRDAGFKLTNSTDGGEGHMFWPADIREKISKANKGKVPSTANRLAVSAANTGRRASIELRHKLSVLQMGHPVTLATRNKIGLGNKGRKPSLANQLALAAYRNRGQLKVA